MDIAAIGRQHLTDALNGKLSKATVDEWKDETGEKVVVYWRPLTGKEQKIIDGFTSNVDKICATVKHRCRDETGRLVFGDCPIESLVHDYDFQVIQAIAFLMVSGMGQDYQETIEEIEKE